MRLSDTFSEKTAGLHAVNVVSDLYQNNVDPVKKSKISHASLLERLAEDKDSIEIVSRVDVPLRRDAPIGVPFLEDSDLAFLRTGMRETKFSPLISEMEFEEVDEERDETNAQNKTLQAELETRGSIGLSAQELNDLLDF